MPARMWTTLAAASSSPTYVEIIPPQGWYHDPFHARTTAANNDVAVKEFNFYLYWDYDGIAAAPNYALVWHWKTNVDPSVTMYIWWTWYDGVPVTMHDVNMTSSLRAHTAQLPRLERTDRRLRFEFIGSGGNWTIGPTTIITRQHYFRSTEASRGRKRAFEEAFTT